MHRLQCSARRFFQLYIGVGCELFQGTTQHVFARLSEPFCEVPRKVAHYIQYALSENAANDGHLHRLVDELVDANVGLAVEKATGRVWILLIQVQRDFPRVLDYCARVRIHDHWDCRLSVAFAVCSTRVCVRKRDKSAFFSLSK